MRTLRDERRRGRRGERLDELRTVECRNIRFELRRLRGPKSPARMLDPILAQPGPPGGVAPVMLRDELLVRSLRRVLRLAGRRHRQGFPAPASAPLIFRQNATVPVLETMCRIGSAE